MESQASKDGNEKDQSNNVVELEDQSNADFEENELIDTLKAIPEKHPCTVEELGGLRVEVINTVNVLLMGKTKNGKSTLLKTLISPRFRCAQSFYSQTRNPHIVKLCGTFHNNESLQVTILDTPGLKEHLSEKTIQRADEVLFDLVIKCIFNGITSLNLICLVYRAGNMTPEDVQVLESIIDHFPESFKDITALIITHADHLSMAERKNHEDQVKNDQNLKKVMEFCGKGIFFSSMIPDLVNDEPDQEGYYFKKVKQDREVLWKLFLSCAEAQQTKELTKVQNEMKKYLDGFQESVHKDLVEEKTNEKFVVKKSCLVQ